MGVVYLARDPFIEREVAIKLLRAIDDDDAQERFQREIRIAGALSHPNIVRIYDAGAHDGQPFVAMEYVNGQTLAEMIKAGVPLELNRKIEMLLDLADGLGYAHKRGVIHRDIKPSNLIIDDHGALKILDFGIARLSDAGRTSLSAVGTPSYMAPEQILGHTVDARCDLFSFGVVVYELVAYRQPFTGDTEHSVYHRILNTEPSALSEVAPGTPASLDAFIRTALAKQPDHRFQTAKALGDDLRAIRGALTADETLVVARPKARGMGGATPLSHPVLSQTPLSGAPPTAPPAPDARSGSGAQRSPASRRLADLRERQVAAAKDDARRALAEGRPQDAMEAAERALVLDEQDASAHELAELARQAIEREQVQGAIAQAERHLQDGALTLARQVIEHARAQVPGDAGLASLEQRIAQQAHERELAARRAAQLRDAIEQARHWFEQGDLETAAATVDRAIALEPDNSHARDLRAAIEAAQRTRQAEAAWHDAARRACAHARELAGRGAMGEAIAMLGRFSPPHPIVTGLAAELRTREAVLAEDQRRREAEAQRVRQRAQGVEQATRLLAAGDADGVLRVLAELRGAGIVDDEVTAIEHRATDLRLALAQRRRREAVLARGIETARTLLAGGDADAALLAIEQLRADGFTGDVLDGLGREASALHERHERERQQQIERDRQAARLAAGLTEVKAAIARRDPDAALAAIALLRRDGLDGPEFASLEAHARTLQQQVARERQQQIEQQRRDTRLARGVAEIRTAIEKRDADAAAASLALLEREGFSASDLAAHAKQVRALQDQIEKERRDQIERDRRAARLARGIEDARAALRRRDARAAIDALGQLEKEKIDAPELPALKREAKTLEKQLERERREAAAAAAVTAAAGGGLAPGEPRVAAEPWAQPVAAGPSIPKLPLLVGAGVLVALLAIGGVWWALRTPGAPTGTQQAAGELASPAAPTPATAAAGENPVTGSPVAETPTPGDSRADSRPLDDAPPAATTSGAETTAAVTQPGVETEASRLISESARLERRGELRGAAQLLEQARSSASSHPADAGVIAARLRSMVSQARRRADRAREQAEQANAVGNDEFFAAARTMTQAQRAADSNPQQALGQFLDAESGFDRARAAAAGTAGTRPSTTPGQTQAPGQTQTPPGVRPRPEIPREVPPVNAGPTQPPVSTPAKPEEPRPAPAPSGPDTSAEQKQVEAVVRRYFSARSSLNLQEVQQVYPGVPASRERDTLRSIERACETFSEQPTQISVVSVTAQEAIVRSRAKTTCRQRAGGRETDIPEVEVFITLRKNGGVWQISQVNRPDRVR